LRVSLFCCAAQKLNFNGASVAIPSDSATLDDRVRAPFVALEAWLDRDEQIILLDEAKSDKSAWRTNIPVDMRRWRYEDQTVVGRGGRCTKLG
jgi:hypothetical protein